MRRLLATTAIVGIAVAPVLAGCGSSDSSNAAASTAAAETPASASGGGKTWSSPPKQTIDENATYTATMKTSKGTITIKLDPKQAPKTVNNFVFLSKEGFYNGGTFHRVIPGFVIQGGDPEGTGTGGPGYQFADELPNAGAYKIGSVAMANSGPNTGTSSGPRPRPGTRPSHPRHPRRRLRPVTTPRPPLPHPLSKTGRCRNLGVSLCSLPVPALPAPQ
jgi:hypothetical protein